MLTTNWTSLIIISCALLVSFYLHYKHKHGVRWSRWDNAKEAALATLMIVGGALLIGLVRIEGSRQSCSYNRYEGPDACYDEL